MTNNKHLIKLKEAYQAVDSGDFENALKIYAAIIEDDSRNIDAYFNMANIFHLKGQIGKAIKSFQKVLELDPHHTDASISLSVLLNDIGQYEKAQEVFEKANQHVKKETKGGVDDPHLNKKFSQRHYEIAEMYYSYARLDESLFEYNKAIGLDPENLEIRIKVAKVYAKKGFVSKAFEELKRLKNEYPSYIPAKMALGLLYFENGNILEAQTMWKNILAQDPAHADACMYLKLSDSATEVRL